MTRFSILLAALSTVGLHATALANLGNAEPTYRAIPPDVMARVRLEAAAETPQSPRDFEDSGAPQRELAEIERRRAAQRVGANDDNSSCHYARGSTMILHIFINGSQSWVQWSQEDMDNAAARAQIAKEYFVDIAPPETALTFDNLETAAYYSTVVDMSDSTTTALDWAMMEDALSRLGLTDLDGDTWIVDDYTRNLQNWNGGWDNVILCFETIRLGDRSFASYEFGWTAIYSGSSINTWKHEWGHLFGACDEYTEYIEEYGTSCNYGMNCGPCQSVYLDEQYYNGNCEHASCPDDNDCLMKSTATSPVCGWTRQQWSWEDENVDGQLDWVKRRESGSTFRDIMEIWPGGTITHYTQDNGYAAHIIEPSWHVFAVRSPVAGDYDLTLFGDNNHTYAQASSEWGGGQVDFIVADHNHSRTGVQHLQVDHFSGSSENYRVSFAAPGVLHADGVTRSGTWGSTRTISIWEVPLFAGEVLEFDLDLTSGGMDMGMALFGSSGSSYYAGRSDALWTKDLQLPGGESHVFTVPATDVYGFVVWSNAEGAGTFDITIGPTPIALAEDLRHVSTNSLQLYYMDPVPGTWSVISNRPSPGNDVALKVYKDAEYTSPGAFSDEPGDDIAFVAIDHPQFGASRDHVRTHRIVGSGPHETEWEQGPELLTGYQSATWSENDVAKAWSVDLEAGTLYYFRQYHTAAPHHRLDTSMHLFAPDTRTAYHARDAADISSDRPGGDGGEWFYFIPEESARHGLVVTEANGNDDGYSVWWGRHESFQRDVPETYTGEALFSSPSLVGYNWSVLAARTEPGASVEAIMYDDDDYATPMAGSAMRERLNFVVGDHSAFPVGSLRHVRFRQTSAGPATYEYDHANGAELPFTPGSVEEVIETWVDGEVVEVWHLVLAGERGDPEGATILVEAIDPGMDLGIAVFDGTGHSYAGLDDALAHSDAVGTRHTEVVSVERESDAVLGIVITNTTGVAGMYRIQIGDAEILDLPEAPIGPQALALRVGANPVRTGTSLHVDVPEAGVVSLDVFDVTGRRVAAIHTGTLGAGTHVIPWDGRDDGGRSVVPGVYVARARSGTQHVERKLVVAGR